MFECKQLVHIVSGKVSLKELRSVLKGNGRMYIAKPCEQLSLREYLAIKLILEHGSQTLAAYRSGVSKKTINDQKKTAMRKLGVTKLVELVKITNEKNLTTLGSKFMLK